MSLALIGMAFALKIMAPEADKAPQIATGIILMAGAMAIMAVAMVAMTLVPPATILASLVALGGMMTLLAVFAAAGPAITGGMMAVGGGVALLGAGIALLAAGALMGVIAMERLLNLVANSPETFKKVAANMGGMVESMKTIIPAIGEIVGLAMASIITVVVNAIITLVKTLAANAGTLASAGMQLMIAFLEGMMPYVADLVKVGVEILAQIMYGLALAMPMLIDSAVTLILSFLDGLVDAIAKYTDKIIDIGWNLVLTILAAIAKAIQKAITNIKQIGKALWEAITAAVIPGGKGAEEAFGILADQLNGMKAVVDIEVTPIEDLGNSLDNASEMATKFKGALKGAKDGVSDFNGSMADLKPGSASGGIAGMLGLDGAGDGQINAVEKETFLPTDTPEEFGKSTGEATAKGVATGYEEEISDTSPGGSSATTKKSTEDYVKYGITGPLTEEGKKANTAAKLMASGMADRVVSTLSAELSPRGSKAPSKIIANIVKDTNKDYMDALEKSADEAERVAALKALDDADEGLLKAYEATKTAKWNEERDKAIAEAQKTGAKIPEIYMSQEEKWAEAAKTMTEAQYEALKQSTKISRVAADEFQKDYEAVTKAEMAALDETWIGNTISTIRELGLEAGPFGLAATTIQNGISGLADTVEKAKIPRTLSSISTGLSRIGKIVPELDVWTSAFGEFASTLSTIGTDGVSSVSTMYKALSSLGSALIDIAIDKLKKVSDTISNVANAAISGVSDVITSSSQIAVDLVIDVSSWVLKGGEEKLPDLGEIMGSLMDSIGGGAVTAGQNMADAMITGMMDVFGLGAFSGVITAFTGMFGTLTKMATSAFAKLIPMVYTAMKNLTRKMMPTWLVTFGDSFQKIFKRFFNKLFGESAGDDSAKWFREHGTQLGEVYVEGIKTSTSTGGDLVEQTGNWLTDIANKLKSSGGVFGLLAGELVQSFADAWNGFNNWFTKIGEGIVGLITAGASGNVAVIYDYIQDLLYHLTNGLLGKDADINHLGENIPDWLLGDKQDEVITGVKKFIKMFMNVLTLGVFTTGEDSILLGKIMNDRIISGLASSPEEALGQIITGIIQTLLAYVGTVIPDLVVLGGKIINAIFDAMIEFIKQGNFGKTILAIINGLIEGLIKSELNIFDVGWSIAKAMWTGFLAMLGINSPSKLAEEVIGYIVDGLENGITNFGAKVLNAGKELATKLWDGFKDLLGIKSPSKKFKEGGLRCIQGLTNGLSDTTQVDKAMEEIANSMRDGLYIIEGSSPTITPIVDLGEVKKQSKAIQGMFGGIRSSNLVATAVVNRQNGTESANRPTSSNTSPANVVFQQTINSPTQLSPRQIYRQTTNLIELKKGALA
jgi:hypothetical protein